MERIILHIDMDAFFAAIEQRDNPELQGKPVVVGGGEGNKGVVSTASYEARKFGIHSAMPIYQARELCPNAKFIKGNFKKYVEESIKL
nr:DNA polymerase IV [Candidatus Cloacimonadota bacterium]